MRKWFALIVPGAVMAMGSLHGEFYAEGSFLYWSARFQEINFVALVHVEGTTGDRQILSFKSPDYPFDPGFKAGLGYEFECRGWDMFANWTHIQTRPFQNVKATNKNQLSPIADFGMITMESTQTRGTITFDTIDFELAYECPLNLWLSLRPFVGLKTLLLHYHIKSRNFNAVSESETVTDYVSVLHDHPWGIGPRIGLDTKWYITPHFTFLFNGAAALLWENFYTVGATTFLGNGVPHGGGTFNNVQGILPVGELFVGFGYEGCVTPQLSLEAKAGYEIQLFTGQIPAAALGNQPEARLGLHGLTASLLLHF